MIVNYILFFDKKKLGNWFIGIIHFIPEHSSPLDLCILLWSADISAVLRAWITKRWKTTRQPPQMTWKAIYTHMPKSQNSRPSSGFYTWIYSTKWLRFIVPTLWHGCLLFFITEAALHSLLGALTSDTYDDTTQHLEREQALAKQFAEILHFTLRFDELKVRLSFSNIPQVSISASKPQTDLLRCWYKLCTFLLWCTPDFLVALQTADAPELIFSSVQFYAAASEHMISI